MKLITWNLNGRRNRTLQQVEALAAQGTDLVALQEVTANSLPELRTALAARELVHNVDGFATVPLTARPRKYRQLVASRFPVRLLDDAIPVPWPEAVLATIVETPHGEIELYNCHIPPGSQYGWTKVETLEGIFKHLARPATRPRILCGDFNTPQAERADGTVITFGQVLGDDGQVTVRRRRQGGPGERWDAAERSVLTGLAAHDLSDVFRRLHGYGVAECSWRLKRHGEFNDRRFDHVFASAALNPVACWYVHDWREAGLSDHSALEVVFAPQIGLPGSDATAPE
jgi:endonuclease/exonuclease/phosphatase family metal-dependent hydrolase